MYEAGAQAAGGEGPRAARPAAKASQAGDASSAGPMTRRPGLSSSAPGCAARGGVLGTGGGALSQGLALIPLSEPTSQAQNSYAGCCL